MKINKIEFHRNGISGIGFHVVLFDADDDKDMMAVVFPEDGAVAVLNVPETAKGNIEFAKGNSWRGDYFERDLRKAIEEYENERPLGGTPFAMPALIKEGEV